MGEAKRRAEANIWLSICLPSRGRPAKCIAAVRSLMQGYDLPLGVEVIIGLDTDDDTRGQVTDALAGTPRVAFSIDAPEVTLGRKFNRLAAAATGRWVMWMVDDYTIPAPRWPEFLREELTDPWTVYYLRDDLHPDFTTFPVVSRKMLDVVGFLFAPWFPFWFGDTWWDEIGTLINRKQMLSVAVVAQEGRGKTQGLRDVGFWAEFFEATRGWRVRQAGDILAKVHASRTDEAFVAEAADMERRDAECRARVQHLRHPNFVAQMGQQSDGRMSPNYMQARKEADGLFEKIKAAATAQGMRRPSVLVAVPSNAMWLARMGTCLTAMVAYSTHAGIDTHFMNVESSMISKGRNDLAQMAIDTGSDYIMFIDTDMMFPVDALVRLLRHQKDIVGATYNKRVPPFESLGKLLGPAPAYDDLKKGPLMEAMAMPGGMMLIRTTVFKNLPWPWFYETYRFPGETGLDMFKSMLKACFATTPGDDVLASIEGTPLGDWVTANWPHESATEWRYMSEDYQFCRQARRYGYRIWCDTGLTFEMRHVGYQEVTTKLPEPVVVAEAAE